MALSHSDYLEGAIARRNEAWALYEAEEWAGVIYLSGRAAESLLRSLIAQRELQFEFGHDLRELFKRVGRLFPLPLAEVVALENGVNDIATVWRNDLRFAGKRRMLRLLKEAGRLSRIGGRRVVGDPLKANAKALVEACETIITRGEPLCKRFSKE